MLICTYMQISIKLFKHKNKLNASYKKENMIIK